MPSKVFIARLKPPGLQLLPHLLESGGVNSRHEIVKLANPRFHPTGDSRFQRDGWMDGFLGIILRDLLEKFLYARTRSRKDR